VSRELTPEEMTQIAKAFERLSANVCHVCGAVIQQQDQVGHSVYARPCGHRLYQGSVGAFAPQPGSQEGNQFGKVKLMSRGPGGKLMAADVPWVRAMRRDRVSWKIIASYFVPQPSVLALRRLVRGAGGGR
jgi:hypothetical protein